MGDCDNKNSVSFSSYMEYETVKTGAGTIQQHTALGILQGIIMQTFHRVCI